MRYAEACQQLTAAQDIDAITRAVAGAFGDDHAAAREHIAPALAAAITRVCQREQTGRSAHSQRLEAIGKMAAAISHELRNPLSGIKITAEYLMKKLQAEPDIVEVITNIHNEVIYATGVIANILDHAKVLKPQLQRASLAKAIDEAVLTVSQQGCCRAVEIKREYPEHIPLLLIDPMQMRQVFMNLIMNAAEAMLGGGSLRISVRVTDATVAVAVKDTGPGIDPEQLRHLFEPFFTTKPKGIGLGLSVVKEMIDNHGGAIDIESKKGKGTLITVRLPVPAAPADADTGGIPPTAGEAV